MAVLLAGLMGLSGAMTTIDHWIYDQCLSMAPVMEETSPAVLLVSSSSEILACEQKLQEIVEKIEKLGATGIAFTTPLQSQISITESKHRSGWIVIPDKFYDPRTRETLSEFAFSDEHDQTLFVGFSPSTDGVVRSQRMEFSDVDGRGVSLEAAIANRWFGSDWPAPHETFLISYSVRNSALPTVAAEVVLADGLVPELVRNRVVLIGFERDLSSPGIVGPIRASVPMTPLEAHGYAVNSLLTQSWHSTLSIPTMIAVVVFGSMVVLLFFPRYPKMRRRLLAILLVAELTVGWIALNYAHIWISVGVLWIAQICTAVSYSALSRWHVTDLIERAVFHVHTRVHLQKITSVSGMTESIELPGSGSPQRKVRSTADLSSKLFHGLDCLHREMDLLEHLFNQAGTGIALYDEEGVLTRINQSLRTFLTQHIPGEATSSLGRVQTAVKQVLKENSPVSFAFPIEAWAAEAQIHMRPIEFNWSSSISPIGSIDVLRTKFVICEWNLPHVNSALEESPATDERDLIMSIPSTNSHGSDETPSTGPTDEEFATVMTDFTETRNLRNPFHHDRSQRDTSSPQHELELEAVTEPVYE